MRLTLDRLGYFPDATYGSIRFPGGLVLVTVECPWDGNLTGISCIPEGEYRMVPGTFHKGGYSTWELVDVPGRSLIKFHAANLALELQGCIAPGLQFGVIGGSWGVTSSRRALGLLMDELHDCDVCTIEVRQHRPFETKQGRLPSSLLI